MLGLGLNINKQILSGGASLNDEYVALLAAWGTAGYTLPDANHQLEHDTLITNLKTASIWDKLNKFAIFALGDANAVLLQSLANWKDGGATDAAFLQNGAGSVGQYSYNPDYGITIGLNTWTVGGSTDYLRGEPPTGHNYDAIQLGAKFRYADPPFDGTGSGWWSQVVYATDQTNTQIRNNVNPSTTKIRNGSNSNITRSAHGCYTVTNNELGADTRTQRYDGTTHETVNPTVGTGTGTSGIRLTRYESRCSAYWATTDYLSEAEVQTLHEIVYAFTQAIEAL